MAVRIFEWSLGASRQEFRSPIVMPEVTEAMCRRSDEFLDPLRDSLVSWFRPQRSRDDGTEF